MMTAVTSWTAFGLVTRSVSRCPHGCQCLSRERTHRDSVIKLSVPLLNRVESTTGWVPRLRLPSICHRGSLPTYTYGVYECGNNKSGHSAQELFLTPTSNYPLKKADNQTTTNYEPTTATTESPPSNNLSTVSYQWLVNGYHLFLWPGVRSVQAVHRNVRRKRRQIHKRTDNA